MKINDMQSSIIINMIKFFKIFIISIAFSLLIDFFFGKLILKKLDKFFHKSETSNLKTKYFSERGEK